MEHIRSLPKVNLPYGMLLTRLFNHIVSNFPELLDDRYILCDRVMHPLAPHYERKTRSDHGMKRCRHSNPSSCSNALDHSSSSHHVDENDDANDEESFHSNSPSPFNSSTLYMLITLSYLGVAATFVVTSTFFPDLKRQQLGKTEKNSELVDIVKSRVGYSGSGFPQHLKSKDADSTMIQTLQVQVTELKSENEGLKLSVEELTKARELVEVTLRQRDELVSAQCEKMRLLEEQSETFHEAMNVLFPDAPTPARQSRQICGCNRFDYTDTLFATGTLSKKLGKAREMELLKDISFYDLPRKYLVGSNVHINLEPATSAPFNALSW
ncbi:hypothetical protein Tco_0620938 [Tanacetum coccineum]